MWLIVGLGNPGEEYTRTRHNIGFRAIDTLGDRYGLRFDDKRGKARIAEGSIAGQRVALAKPFTFMNLSGQAVTSLTQWYKIDPATQLLVVYDDLDLPWAALRLRERGSAGTHNGMKSIVQLLGSQQFPRLRIGIDRTPPGWQTANYVLSRFSREQEEEMPQLLGAAADAIELIIREGFTAAMNRFNGEGKKS
ncbi:MAG: aminoacyl-tRNA hydrolase [Roseiflexaceae bacterium]|nr:aminoacyl-tRNA hydrolase [Roseiflexaceae bacterium]